MRFSQSIVSALMLTAMISTAQAEVLIGVAAPLTGPNSAFGAQLQKGAEQAAADINAAGGINGEQIKVELGDDVSDPKQGISVANKFVADGVKFVVGHFNSGVSIPASEVYAENGILEITPAASNPQFTERGLWNTFRTCGRDDQQGVVAATFIAENYRNKKIAIIDDGSAFGAEMAENVSHGLSSVGISIALRQQVGVGDKDFSSLISSMKDASVSVIYWGGLYDEAGLIIRQGKEQGLEATLVSGDGIDSTNLAAIAGDAVEGTQMTSNLDPAMNPTNKDLVAKFKAAGFNPEGYTLRAYAAMQSIAGAAKAAGSNDPEAVARAMKEKGPFPSVLGDISFDSGGDPKIVSYGMSEWKKGSDGKFGPSLVSVPETCGVNACEPGKCCSNNMCKPC